MVDPTPEPFQPEPERSSPPRWEPERWERQDAPGEAPPARKRDRSRGGKAGGGKKLGPVRAELVQAVGSRSAARAEGQYREALSAFEAGRWQDAWKALKPVADTAPGAASVRELAGLILYRLGRWKLAAGHLEAFRALTGSTERNPVLADCYRALRRYRTVHELWDELRRASPGAELVAEGRIVAAGALADRGEVGSAVALLEAGPIRPRGAPKPYHLRLWYALADLYERSGDPGRARDLFSRIAAVDPELADTVERLEGLG